MRRHHSFWLIAAVLALGSACSLCPRYLLDGVAYQVALLRFALFGVCPLVALLFLFFRKMGERLDRVAFWISLAVLLIGLFAGTLTLVVIRANVTVGAVERQVVGIACFAGSCAALIVAQKLLRDASPRV